MGPPQNRITEQTSLNPRHARTRAVLRALGPALAALGLLLTLVGMGSFFSSFGSFEPPRYFWCAFLGLPLLFAGIFVSMLAFSGAFTRYVFGEAAPVQRDTFNYLAEGTRGGVRTLADAVGEGLSSGMAKAGEKAARCGRCGQGNDADAKFCKGCGTPLGTPGV